MLQKSNIPNWTSYWAKKNSIPYYFFKEVSSTNDAAKAVNSQLELELFLAESQSKGRGTKDKIWLNSDLMLSWKLKVNHSPQPHTILLMSEALKQALKLTWPAVPIKIKKPNDLYIKEKKLAGLLIEAVSEGNTHQVIIGTGVNVFSAPKPEFTCLQDHLEIPILKQKWTGFLSQWQRQIKFQIPFCFVKQ